MVSDGPGSASWNGRSRKPATVQTCAFRIKVEFWIMSLGPRPKQVKFTVSLMPQIGDWQWLSRVVERTCPRVMIIAAVRSREAIRAAM